jgi:Zn-dependent M28 family amino/carboxypeptidase
MYVNTLKVSREKLLAHIRALNYRRYTEAERDRTRSYLTKSLKQLGWKPELQTFEGGVNIFAQRQGTDAKAGSILVGAHYDTVSVSPGADDNATGVAVVLEVARLLGSRPTPRTLQLALFDREELGLLGSRAFVANEKHLENLQGAIVMDMVGFACHKVGCQKYPQGLPVVPPSDKGDFLAVVGDMEHATLLDAFQPSGQDNLPPVLTLPVPLKGMLMPDTLRSDHAPFWYRGVGAVLLTDTANLRTPHYHQPSDTPATLDKSFFSGAAQIVVNATTKLLDSDHPKAEVKPSDSSSL